MGAGSPYRKAPDTETHVEDVSDAALGLRAARASMCGWRKNQEDADLCLLDFDTPSEPSPWARICLLAVFDGHGGPSVSAWAARRLPSLLKELPAYQEGRYGEALTTAFLQVDVELDEEKGKQEIAELDRELMCMPGSGDELEQSDSDAEAGAGLEACEAGLQALQQDLLCHPLPADEVSSTPTGAAAAPARDSTPDKEPSPKAPKAPKEPKAKAKAGPDDSDDGGSASDETNELGEAEMRQLVADHYSADGEEEEEFGGAYGQGCTAVVALVLVARDPARPGEVWVANAGDSRCLLSREGRAVALSTDHKPESPGEFARITAAGSSVSFDGYSHRIDNNLNLSRALGDLRYKRVPNTPPEKQPITADPEITHTTLGSKDEFLVLGCDGVWERIPNVNQGCVDCLAKSMRKRGAGGPKLSTGCEEWLNTVLSPDPEEDKCEGCDNMSIVCMQLPKTTASAETVKSSLRPRKQAKYGK